MSTNPIYNRVASNWEQRMSFFGYSAAYAGLLKNRINPYGAVLDAGTGTGTFARVWAEAGGSKDLTLLDPSQAMLAAAQANLGAVDVAPKVELASIEAFDTSVPYATILAAHVIEHCPAPELALQNFADWLEPEGRLFLVVSKPHWCNWLIWLRYRHRWFSAQQVYQMAARAGLHALGTHVFKSGSPSRTSLGYLFAKPKKEIE